MELILCINITISKRNKYKHTKRIENYKIISAFKKSIKKNPVYTLKKLILKHTQWPTRNFNLRIYLDISLLIQLLPFIIG